MSSSLDMPGSIDHASGTAMPRRDWAAWATRLSCLCLGTALPVGMSIANRSAPVFLVLSALLALPAFIRGRPARMVWRDVTYRLTQPLALIAFACCALAVASLIWTVDRPATLRGLSEVAPEIVFGCVAGFALPASTRRGVGIYLVVGLMIASAIILVEALAGMPIHQLVGARVEYTSLKRSAITLAILSFPAFVWLVGRAEWLSVLALGMLVWLAVIAAHSSSAAFALIAGGIVVALARLWRAPTRALLLGAIVVGLAVAPIAGTAAVRLLPPRVVALLQGAHAAHRIQIWTAFESRVPDRRWQGHGFATAASLWTTPRPNGAPNDPTADGVIERIHPHNSLLQIWVEFGLAGGLAAALIFIAMFRRIADMPPSHQPARLGFVAGVLAVALVGLGAWQAWWLATVAAGTIWFFIVEPRADAFGPTETAHLS